MSKPSILGVTDDPQRKALRQQRFAAWAGGDDASAAGTVVARPQRVVLSAVVPGAKRAGAVLAKQASPKRRKMVKLSNSTDDVKDLLTSGIIVGTSTTLEKPYLRLTSAPDPSTVRPPQVLRRALVHLKKKWLDGAGYEFACEQLKSIRQDLTVQHLKDEFVVEVYETHARIALEEGDLDEFSQCQAKLRELYAAGIEGHEDEFVAYRLLHNAVRRHRSGHMGSVANLNELSPEQRALPVVHHAFLVQNAINTKDYFNFFRLYQCAPNMGGYLMDHLVEKYRVGALHMLVASYRPSVPVAFVAQVLAFRDPRASMNFLREQGAVFLEGSDDTQLDAKESQASMGVRSGRAIADSQPSPAPSPMLLPHAATSLLHTRMIGVGTVQPRPGATKRHADALGEVLPGTKRLVTIVSEPTPAAEPALKKLRKLQMKNSIQGLKTLVSSGELGPTEKKMAKKQIKAQRKQLKKIKKLK